ncbi:hypothetical protein [Pyrococcus kukulkanii]
MKKFLIFLFIVLLVTLAFIGIDEVVKNVLMAVTIALVLRIVDEVVE